MQASISVKISEMDYDKVVSFIKKYVKIQNEDMNSFLNLAIQIATEEISDTQKAIVIQRLFQEGNTNICRYLSDYISKQFFDVKISSIDFQMIDIME